MDRAHPARSWASWKLAVQKSGATRAQDTRQLVEPDLRDGAAGATTSACYAAILSSFAAVVPRIAIFSSSLSELQAKM